MKPLNSVVSLNLLVMTHLSNKYIYSPLPLNQPFNSKQNKTTTTMSLKLKFATLDVFTHDRYAGNPLAIVHIPSPTTLTYSQKLAIAAEFNLSETVFLHEPLDPSTATEVEINIFLTTGEIPFAGHPTVGTGFYLLSGMSGLFRTGKPPSAITLKTLSGRIPVSFDPVKRIARLSVAHDVKIHPGFDCAAFKAENNLANSDYVNGLSGLEPICSIVKKMNFFLWELTSLEALGKLQVRSFPRRVVLPEGYLGDHEGFLGVYSFVRLDTTTSEDGQVVTMKLRTRMFNGLLEDPATGSAASAIGSYLALTTPGEVRVRVFEITQGVEMGRKSDIKVKVVLTDDGNAVKEVGLEGGAVNVIEGVLTL